MVGCRQRKEAVVPPPGRSPAGQGMSGLVKECPGQVVHETAWRFRQAAATYCCPPIIQIVVMVMTIAMNCMTMRIRIRFCERLGLPPRITLPANPTPLWVLLDDVARQGALHWRVVPGGAEFYRVETRVFELAGTPQVANTSASLGRNGSGQLFESTSKTGFTTEKQDVLKGVLATVEAMLSVGGRASLSPESQTLVVTDVPDNMKKIAKYVERLLSPFAGKENP